ncbi:MAG TPA: HEAT repeat domain-containing protein [Pyrinomonadaceae bacterium]|jgi:hypothetical protein
MPRSHLSRNQWRILLAALAILLLLCTSFPTGAQQSQRRRRSRPARPQQTNTNNNSTATTGASSQPAKKSLTELRASDSPQGGRATITSDVPLNDYEAYRSGNRYYVVIPQASAPTVPGNMRARGFEDVEVHKRGNDTVLSFRLKPGTTAYVKQKFNKLDVVFNSPGAAGQPPQTGPDAINPQSTTANSLTGNTNGQRTGTETAPGTTRPPDSTTANINATTATPGALTSSTNTSIAPAPSTVTTVPGITPELPTVTPALGPTAETPATATASPTPPTDQLAQAQPVPSVPTSITTTPTTPVASGTSLGAVLKSNWLLVLIAALLLIGIGLVAMTRSRSRREETEPRPVSEDETPALEEEKATETARRVDAATAAPGLDEASVAGAAVVAAEPSESTALPAAIVDETETVETAPAETYNVERVRLEIKHVLTGEPYDESVINAPVSETRQLIESELLFALSRRNTERRHRALKAFTEHGYFDDATRDLRTAAVAAERAAAARKLGLTRDTASTPHLVAALEDPAPEVRRAAIEALAEVQDPSAVAPLESLLEHDEDRRVPHALIQRAIRASAAGPAEQEVKPAPTTVEPASTVEAAEEATTAEAAPVETALAEGATVESAPVAAEEVATPVEEAAEPSPSFAPLASGLVEESSASVMQEPAPAPGEAATLEAEPVPAQEDASAVPAGEMSELSAASIALTPAIVEGLATAEAGAAERRRAEADAARIHVEQETRRQLAEEEERQRAEEDALYRRVEEAARLRAEAETQRLAEETRQREEEQRRRLEEERRRAEEERIRAEEEQHRIEAEERRAEEERLAAEERRAAEERQRLEEEQRRAAEEQRREEEERRRLEEERLRLEEERLQVEAEQRRVEEEQRRAEEERLRVEEERRRVAAEAERQGEEAEAERLRAEQERLRVEEEARRRDVEERASQEEEERRKVAGEEQQRIEEARRQRAQERERRRAEEERGRFEAEERERGEAEAARRRAEDAALRLAEMRRRMEEEARQREEAEAERLRAEEEARRLAEEEAARQLEEEEAQIAQHLAEEEERLRLEEERLQVEAEQRRVEEEQRRAEEERLRVEEERRRVAAEAERQREEAEAERLRAEQERLRAEEEEARVHAEEERRRVEEEARQREEAEAARIEFEREAEEQRLRRAEAEASLVESGAASQVEPEEIERGQAETPVTVVQSDLFEATFTERTSFASSTDISTEAADNIAPDWVDVDINEMDAATVEQPYASTYPVVMDEAAEEAVPVKLVEEYGAEASVKEIEAAVMERGIATADEDYSSVPGGILRRLSSESSEERAAAVSDLSRVGGEDAFREISASFDDPSQQVRDAAARALFNLNDDHAASFTRALREAPPERRRKIGNALATSGLASQAIGHLMGESREKTYDAFSLLFLMSKAGEVQPLMRAIEEHPNSEVRLAVVKLLALSGQQEILPAFRRLAVRGSLPTEVRSAVMEAIYQISSQTSADTTHVA